MRTADRDVPDEAAVTSSLSGDRAAAEKSKLQPLEVAMQLLGHVQLLWFVYSGSLGYIELQLIFAAEVIILNVLSIPFYRSRGVATYISSMVMTVLGLAVVLTLSLAAPVVDSIEKGHRLLPKHSWMEFAIGIAYMLIRSIGILVVALNSSDPKLSWARSSLTSGAVTFLTMFLMVFIGFFGGFFIINALALAGAHADVTAVLAVIAIVLHFGLTLVMDTTPEKDMREIAETAGDNV